MTAITALLAAAFVAAEGGEELRLFQTTETKDFREIATSGFTIHPYPGVEALDIDTKGNVAVSRTDKCETIKEEIK